MRLTTLCTVLLLIACRGEAPSNASARGSATPGSAAVAPGSAAVTPVAPPDGSVATADMLGSAATPATSLPPKVAALGATLEALLREPDSDARSRKTCAQFMKIKRQAIAVAREVPPGVDPAAWEAVNEDIRGSLEGLGPNCGDDPPDDSVELPGLYANYKRLLPLLLKAQ